MRRRVIGAVLAASLAGIAFIALLLLAGQWVGLGPPLNPAASYTLGFASFGLGLIAVGFYIRQHRHWLSRFLDKRNHHRS